MNLNLTPNLEQYVRDRAATGDYNNASEVVREAIRLLKNNEEDKMLKLERLRVAIKLGDVAIEQGDFTSIGSGKSWDDFFAKL